MKFLKLEQWCITARLIFITVLPVVLMFSSVVTYSYYSRYAEVQDELAERGKVLASALAQNSEYGIVSGNLADVDRTIRSLSQHDKDIAYVEILNADKRRMLDVQGEISPREMHLSFEEPITRELLAINSFSENGYPHVSSSGNSATTQQAGETLGYVRVEMSPSRMLAKQRHRILIGSAISGMALLISAILGLYLALGLTKPLAMTIASLRQIRKGNYGIQLDITSGGEIGDLQSAIVEMATSLGQFKHEMESKVLARTRELEAARDEAVKSNTEKRKLIQKVNSVVEEERKSVAIELHDQLNASLIVVRLESQRIRDLAAGKVVADQPLDEIKDRAQSIIKLASGLYDMCRSIVRRLRPEVIDTLGLRDAIEEMVHHYDEIHPQCRFGFHAIGDFSELTDELSMTVYRLVQEALSNVVKHSSATEASVRIELWRNPNMLRINISDNGKGFDDKVVEPGIGLIGMRERVIGIAGRLEIHTKHNEGTLISVELPL